ncbi:TPA: hypothetical protein TY768_000927 [Streptococcus suis]|nr:hypothetical protein [Streptococcus suis]
MAYLSEIEFEKLGFDQVENFELLATRAELAIDLYTQNFYKQVDFDTDYEFRKDAVQLAMAYQISYLDASGILTADDKQAIGNVSIGRTSVSYGKGSLSSSVRYNLSTDAINVLSSVGFSTIVGVAYDR